MIGHRSTRFYHDATIDEETPYTAHFPRPLHHLFDALAESAHLNRREKRLLQACLLTREIYRNEMKSMSLDRERVVRAQQDMNVRWRRQMLSGEGWRSRWFLFRMGEDAATQLDFNLQEVVTGVRQRADEAQGPRRREVTEFAVGREERLRASLAEASPYAKRLFNEIAVTGRSLTWFPDPEVRNAASLPGLDDLSRIPQITPARP